MLDAIYKVLSDNAKAAGKSLAQMDPGRPNTGRYEVSNIRAAQQRLLDLMERPGALDIPAQVEVIPSPDVAQSPPPSVREALEAHRTRLGQAATRREGTVMQQAARQALERRAAESAVPAPLPFAEPGMRVVEVAPASQELLPPVMPTMRQAVEDFATRSRGIEGVERGFDAMRTVSSPGGVSAKNLTKKGPTALLEWLKTQDPSLANDASEGALGYIRERVGAEGLGGMVNIFSKTPGRNALLRGGNLLRAIEGAPTAETAVAPRTLLELLRQTGVVGATPNLGDY